MISLIVNPRDRSLWNISRFHRKIKDLNYDDYFFFFINYGREKQ